MDPYKYLVRWYKKYGRDLPWRKSKDPYSILVSEIMLQQTQVDRVIPKYLAWLERFPDFQTLSAASKTDVLRLWIGLGYNSRAIRLHMLAKCIIEEYDGVLPKKEAALCKLPGIGPYTAGAIMAFAHDLPGTCIDVNVLRILKRVSYEPHEFPDKKELAQLLRQIQIMHGPRMISNALMDLGSICTARNPRCEECPIRTGCITQGERPEEEALREKRKQKNFLHSNRWWRGQILKNLTQEELSREELLEKIPANDLKKFENALLELQKEKVVSGSKKIRIAE